MLAVVARDDASGEDVLYVQRIGSPKASVLACTEGASCSYQPAAGGSDLVVVDEEVTIGKKPMLEIGGRLGPYEILAPLGTGGTGNCLAHGAAKQGREAYALLPETLRPGHRQRKARQV